MGGYESNLNLSVAYFYTNHKQAEKEIRETTSFTKAKYNTKYLGVNLTKQVK